MQDAERLLSLMMTWGRRNPMRDPLSAIVEEKALTPSQLHTLVWLGADGPLTMGELARRLCITDKTVTGVVDRLERAELVRRVREDEDRRVVRVALSEEGRRIHGEMRAGMVRKVERFLAFLEPAERAVLFRVIERLQDATLAPADADAKHA